MHSLANRKLILGSTSVYRRELLERLRQLTETDAGMKETARQLAQLDAAQVLTERSMQAVLADEALRSLPKFVLGGGSNIVLTGDVKPLVLKVEDRKSVV